MASKLYKAVDKLDVDYVGLKTWLVNEQGVAVSHYKNDERETISCKRCENDFSYNDVSRFHNDAIDPVLIAEW